MRSKAKLLVLTAATLNLVGLHRATGAIRTWNNPSGGTFSIASNWLGGVAPGSADTARFSLGDAGYTVSFIGSVTNVGLSITNDTVTFDLGGSSYNPPSGGFTGGGSGDVSRLTLLNGTLATSGTISFGDNLGARQTLTVSTDANFINNGTLFIASSGDGTVLVTNGGQMNVATVDLSRLFFTGGGGTLTVTGLASTVTSSAAIRVGAAGHGVMNVLGGASVTAASIQAGIGTQTASGNILVSGNNSSLTATGNMSIGGPGAALMTINQGAFASSGSATIGEFASTGGGAVIVDGGGSIWNAGTLTVGQTAPGSLLVQRRIGQRLFGYHQQRGGSQRTWVQTPREQLSR